MKIKPEFSKPPPAQNFSLSRRFSLPRLPRIFALAAAMVILYPPSCPGANGILVRASSSAEKSKQITLNYELEEYTAAAVKINGEDYTRISLGEESLIKVKGAPEMPNVCRSIIIPDDSEMAVKVVDCEYYEISNIGIPPSKGILPRKVRPGNVPYTFGPLYKTDDFYPNDLALLREPYILRDHRGVVVVLNPFRYNPVRRKLRVYTKVTLEVDSVGPGKINVLSRDRQDRKPSRSFCRIYARRFINYSLPERYDPLDENGDMLIICHDNWLANVQPFVNHKNSLGINTRAVKVSTIGNNATSIKNYIRNIYNSSDLAFVLLVGDAAQIATPEIQVEYETGSADPTYALLEGNDHYPEILVGRFSAQKSSQVDTQVMRTRKYETLPATEQAWFKKGMGIGSDDGPGHHGEYDYEHIALIRQDLLAAGYTGVDQIYDPGAKAASVTEGLNTGRGIVNYCGHGGVTGWVTTAFSNSDVNALTNDNMLPLIFDVACNNGQFDGYTCFAETWLRATHESEPTGAAAIYASSVSQYWDPPMTAQDEATDLLTAGAYWSFGGLCFAAACRMMDEYGQSGQEMFDTWHVFGDPSLRIGGSAIAAASAFVESGDYDGDGTDDIAIYRPGTGMWAVKNITRVYFGQAGDQPVPGDYDGDGGSEMAIFRPSSALWAVRKLTRFYFGSPSDTPIPSDYNGDGRCEPAIFRNASGLWAIRGKTRIYFGGSGDLPIPGDYDGDGTEDIALFRETAGLWVWKNLSRIYFGGGSDTPVPGDYNGDGKWEAAIFRNASGLWAIRGKTRIYFGQNSDQPVPADYDGNLVLDPAIFRPNSGLWAVRGGIRAYFGENGDIPVTR